MNELILKNPITSPIKLAVNKSVNRLNFAVPFLNSFALTLLDKKNVKNITDKRLITRFDSSCLITFDIPVLEKLLELGFKIRFDNNIHLKLYITDDETFVTSSNLTRSGFESNVELTVRVDSENAEKCADIFEDLWRNTENKVDKKLLEESYPKYDLLKKREEFAERQKSPRSTSSIINDRIDAQVIIEHIFKMGDDYSHVRDLTYISNQKRELFKNKLMNGFDKELFYVPKGHKHRLNNLFYDLSYGTESDIAGTGLWERQFQEVFEHPEFVKVIHYIYPEMIGMKPWNLSDEIELYEFCCGIFDFKIPKFKETLPIRLASYFYPEHFIPIFKLSDIERICTCLNLHTNAITRGDRFYDYSVHIDRQMRHLPYESNIKFNIAYIIMHTFELQERLLGGDKYTDIVASNSKDWKKRYLQKAMQVLDDLDMMNNTTIK